jgi:hypothetical protein
MEILCKVNHTLVGSTAKNNLNLNPKPNPNQARAMPKKRVWVAEPGLDTEREVSK